MGEIYKPAILALDAGGTFLKCALFADGEPVDGSQDKQYVNSNATDPEDVRRAYNALLMRQKDFADKHGLCISAVGIDTPGPFDYKNGTSMMKHKYTAIYGISLIPWIKENLGENIRTVFLHDSAAFIRGVAGTMPDAVNIAGVMIGTGLGFALCRGGVPLANEIGGPRVSLYSRPYRGKTAEEFVSARGIVAAYNELSPIKADNAKDVGERAAAGDAIACKVYSEIGVYVSELIAPILKEYQTEALVFGGQISKSFGLFENSLKDGLSGYDLQDLKVIAAAENVDMMHLRGAAAAVMADGN